jgi:hypothetical protein
MLYVVPVGWSRSKYKETQVITSFGPNTGQNHTIKMSNKFFENWTKLKYLEIKATSQNSIHAEITSKLK